MEDNKGHIWKEDDRESEVFAFKKETSILPSPTQSKNFCPNCGSEDLDLERIPVFGNPGYLVKAKCRNCGYVF